MPPPSSPAEIAGKTLKALVAKRLAPTPENYTRIYAEISGQQVAELLGSELKQAEALEKPPLPWAALIRDLLRQLEAHHKGVTLSRKKEGLETVLARFGPHADLLHEKLQGLVRSWGSGMAGADSAASRGEVNEAGSTASGTGTLESNPSGSGNNAFNGEPPSMGEVQDAAMMVHLRALLAQTLESNLTLQPDLTQEIQGLVEQIRGLEGPEQITELARRLRHFWVRMELRGGDKNRIQEGLVSLLRLLVENVGELVADDKWLHGQITVLKDLITQPLDKRSIAEAERNLRDALIKQSTLKKSLSDAKETLKTLMTTFIDRMGEMTESTGDYHAKIEVYSQKIVRADNLTELGHILRDIMQDTRMLQASALRSHEELVAARRQAHEAEQKIIELEQELTSVSELVREDQLTGTLNRRGMEDTLVRETTRADRSLLPLCLALLDIDNFKLLNDLMGHQAGDRALMHTSEVFKGSVRPSDTVARYGGEEFLIIIPETPLDVALEAVQRIQRVLASKFFVYNGEEIVITFSAGVAERKAGETTQAVIERADQAMYAAKRAGKNRVMMAE